MKCKKCPTLPEVTLQKVHNKIHYLRKKDALELDPIAWDYLIKMYPQNKL